MTQGENGKTRGDLIAAVLAEMDRVWGEPGFDGSWEAYAWLQEHYGVSEEEDNQWIDILEYDGGEFPEDDPELTEQLAFVENESAVIAFLERLLAKYRSGTAVYSEG